MKRLYIWIGLAVTLLAGMLAGCRGGNASPEKEKKREKIEIWTYFETDAQCSALDKVIRGFNRSQNSYEASWKYVPMTEFTKKQSMAYTEKALPDLAIIDNPDMSAFIKMGLFEDITGFLKKLGVKKDYYPSLVETVSYGSHMYGLPMNCNNAALIYNKKMLEEKNIDPPESWEELEQAAAALSTESCSGFLMSAVEGEQGAFQILPWILSTGENASEIGGEGTEKALAFLKRMIDNNYMAGDCINMSQNDVGRVFAEGGAAMMENGPWVLPMLDEEGIEYGVSPLPADKISSVIVGGENLGILKGKNVEGAKKFLEYYNQDQVMQAFCQEAQILPAKMNIEIPEDTNLKVFKEQMAGAVVRSSIPSWNILSKQLSQSVYQMVAEQKSPKEAAFMLDVQK